MRVRTTLAASAAPALAVLAGGCGSTHSGSPAPGPAATPARTASTPAAKPRLASVTAASTGSLPAPLSAPAFAQLPDGRVVVLGGLDASGSSTGAILVLSGTSVSRREALPEPQHDAQAATLGSAVYVFGGGGTSELSHILRYDPRTGAVTQVGSLPTPASDVAVAGIGGTAYVVGGYDG